MGKQPGRNIPINQSIEGFWTCYSLADMWQSNCCLGQGGGRVVEGAAGPPVQPSRCYSSLDWCTSLSPSRSRAVTFAAATFRPTAEEDDQGEGWVAREVATARGWPGSAVSIHPSPLAGPFSLICLDGCPLSGAQHDERPWLRCRLCLSCLHLGQW